MKNFLRWFLRIFLLLFILCNVWILITGKTFIYTTLIHTNPDLDDYKIFDNNTVKAGVVQHWPQSSIYNKKHLPDSTVNVLAKYHTTAFLVIQNDSLVYESYYEDGGSKVLSNSFSVAKSIINILTGIALKEGKIKSLDDKVGDYLENFRSGGREKITIRHLMTMSSGLDWDEEYSSLLSPTTEAYYGTDLPKLMAKSGMATTPGTICTYKTIDVQTLSEVLRKATGMSISEYASQKLWSKIGAEQNALWATDHNGGEEKAYCCFSAEASDFARIGQLYLDSGRWKGEQIVDPAFVKLSVTPNMLKDEEGMTTDYYGYLWWIMEYNHEKLFYARGIKGQYVIVVPSKHIVIVRLGQERSENVVKHHHLELEDMISGAISICR